MPSSNLALAPAVLWLIEQVNAADGVDVLDVGPGHGKYAVLLREYLNRQPKRIDAAEAWPDYVDRFNLNRLYDNVLGDALTLTPDELWRYKLVLMIDVIEHMPKAEAQAFLDRCPGWVIVLTPVEWYDNDPHHEHPPTEEHVSHWTAADFPADRVDHIEELYGGLLVRLRPQT